MSGRRRGKGGHEEHHVDERWLVSYADMITVLMALFIVLYAMSTVDQHKFDQLKNSLATGFGVTKTAKIDENKGVVPKKFVHKGGAGFSNSTIALMQVAKEITDELKIAGVQGKATVATGSNTITVSLVGSSTYFDGNSADLRPEAFTVLKALQPALHDHAGTVTVEGHADPRGNSGTYGDDWNLASARANSVLTWLVDHDAVAGAHISSISFGSEHAVDRESKVAVERNRRVDIVLHTVTVATVKTPVSAAEGGTDKAAGAKTSTAKTSDAKTSSEKTSTEKTAEHH